MSTPVQRFAPLFLLGALVVVAGCPSPSDTGDGTKKASTKPTTAKTATPSPKASASASPSAKPSGSPSASPSAGASGSPSPSASPSASGSPSASASPSASPSSSGSASPSASPSASASPDAPLTATVEIQDFKFVPNTITIKKGGTITFTNKGAMAHTVSRVDGAAFTDSGDIAAAASKAIKFDAAGVTNFNCAYHPASMTGTITIVP